MDEQTINATVSSCTATPVNPCQAEKTIQQTMDSTIEVINEAMNDFADEVINETPNEKKAKGFLNSLKNYVKTQVFRDKVNETSKKTGIPPKKVAQNFFERALGTVGDILGIAISVVCNAGRMVVQIAGTICNGIINLIQSIANGIASIVTLNKTCKQPCEA